jgi:hypothetical protein
MTPGGSDLSAVASRNADKLQLLSSMPPPGDPEALDEFLAKFVGKSSQVGGGLCIRADLDGSGLCTCYVVSACHERNW